MAVSAEADIRRLKALDLRLAGASYRQIGQQLGVSHTQASNDVKAMLREMATEPAEEVRQAELSRLNRLLMAHWPKATQGDAKATAIVLQIMDRRARYLGLDAPQKIDLTAWIRDMAEREGIDPDQAVRDAEAIVQGAKL